MPRKSVSNSKVVTATQGKDFHFEFKNTAQKLAYAAFQQHDVLFMIGPAGTGKTTISVAFAVKMLLAKEVTKIILTRPIVESGESLGYLPGTFEEKVDPYMMPIYDAIDKLVGRSGARREQVLENIEIAPLAYLRGRNFYDAVCVFDEAQNASYMQLKLFLTRLCENSKMIITGDPKQSDLRGPVALVEVVDKLKEVEGVGMIEFKNNSIVRHPLVGRILDRLEEPSEETKPTPHYGMRL